VSRSFERSRKTGFRRLSRKTRKRIGPKTLNDHIYLSSTRFNLSNSAAKGGRHLNRVVISDFDGTIVQVDTATFVLEHFTESEWKIFDDLLARGRITLEECMQKQFSLVQGSEREILNELDRATKFRHNWEELVAFCDVNGIPLVVVSAGVDFVIKHLLRPWRSKIEVIAPAAECTSNGITFTKFPKLCHEGSQNFKDDLVRQYKKRNQKVAYIGDTLIDYEAVRAADLAFVVRDSELAAKCKRESVPVTEMDDFDKVVQRIRQDAR
jgi:2,3-diketo-5-methylthio-1-phosphopentane phosphatase